MHTTTVRPWAVAAGVWLLSGCSFDARVSYTPKATNLQTSASVALDVIDARQPSVTGGDTRRVGSLRNGIGVPFPVEENGPDRVAQLVREATADALRQAGVGIKAGSARTLVARVDKFWVDGYAGYKASCELDYSLRDHDGKALWSSEVDGGAGGMHWAGTSIGEELLSKALAECATRAAAQFKSAEFQKLVF